MFHPPTVYLSMVKIRPRVPQQRLRTARIADFFRLPVCPSVVSKAAPTRPHRAKRGAWLSSRGLAVMTAKAVVLLPYVLLLSSLKLHHSLLTRSSPQRSQLQKEGYTCFVTGDCTACTKEEMVEDYCQATRKRQEVTCEKTLQEEEDGEPAGSKRTVDSYEACTQTSADDMSAVLRFQAAMAILGGLALYGVRHQKLKHQTIYERRKLQQARGGRGAYAGL